ncbi:hypothetical protein AMECASPLE_007621 [Ameca splendens]|uniref:Uncharacterized protein n=1 Tax=Ameca splendens TaxID=208324 RepID=A0ABV0YBK2_9TELE
MENGGQSQSTSVLLSICLSPLFFLNSVFHSSVTLPPSAYPLFFFISSLSFCLSLLCVFLVSVCLSLLSLYLLSVCPLFLSSVSVFWSSLSTCLSPLSLSSFYLPLSVLFVCELYLILNVVLLQLISLQFVSFTYNSAMRFFTFQQLIDWILQFISASLGFQLKNLAHSIHIAFLQ